jgi:hypothetical protein
VRRRRDGDPHSRSIRVSKLSEAYVIKTANKFNDTAEAQLPCPGAAPSSDCVGFTNDRGRASGLRITLDDNGSIAQPTMFRASRHSSIICSSRYNQLF